MSSLPLKPAALPKLRRALLSWYDQHRRDLPWRRNADPYRVWLSEIMLQQTRVEAVREHYARFLQRFPTVEALARARESSVLAMWSGLGYYHRARRLHQAAKAIVRERHGIFPRTSEDWQQLPGIGRYTAAAVSSIAFGEPAAVVDGNVERVLARLFAGQDERNVGPRSTRSISATKTFVSLAHEKDSIWQLAQQLLDSRRPGDFNQAMMELGATICTPRAPQCLLCPVHAWCVSRGKHAPAPQPPRKRKQLCYGLARHDNHVLLVQRPSDASLMARMWELPVLSEELLTAANGSTQVVTKFRHSITDTDYQVSVIELRPDAQPFVQHPGRSRWLQRRQWERLPLTGLARKILLRLAH